MAELLKWQNAIKQHHMLQRNLSLKGGITDTANFVAALF
jgi:hypothetical protein